MKKLEFTKPIIYLAAFIAIGVGIGLSAIMITYFLLL
jgi:hypothetical protein